MIVAPALFCAVLLLCFGRGGVVGNCEQIENRETELQIEKLNLFF